MKTTIRQIGLILFVSGFLAVLANTVHPRKIPWVQDWSHQVESRAKDLRIRVVPFSGAKKLHADEEALFVDARSETDYTAGHIPDAVSLPFEALDEHFEQIMEWTDSDQELVVYCSNRECDDALLLSAELKSMGVSNLTLFIDGFDSWKTFGEAVE
ncbi:MAG: rhodanese-like domain-containing protein [Pontiellaceae bacterium]|nr:rhodanese-like domain-containing protein [Pontiellaceae bacterium]MBN2783570.1 rhodanese-like domain-containing protein [Pontiellaceae bacterium]